MACGYIHLASSPQEVQFILYILYKPFRTKTRLILLKLNLVVVIVIVVMFASNNNFSIFHT